MLIIVFYCMDTIGQKTQPFEGVVIEKIFSPAHTECTIYGKPTLIIPVYKNDEWLLKIKLKDFPNVQKNIKVSQKIYQATQEGDVGLVNVRIGRISKQKEIIALKLNY